MSRHDQFGPIEYVAVEFPGGTPTSEGFEQLLALVDSGVIRILDLEFVSKSVDGAVTVVPASSFDLADFDLSQFEGAASGLLDGGDIDTVGSELAPGRVAAVLVYEELAVLPVLEAWTRAGATIVAEGHLSVNDLATALDNTALDNTALENTAQEGDS